MQSKPFEVSEGGPTYEDEIQVKEQGVETINQNFIDSEVQGVESIIQHTMERTTQVSLDLCNASEQLQMCDVHSGKPVKDQLMDKD